MDCYGVDKLPLLPTINLLDLLASIERMTTFAHLRR
jgi:hypothetical protein